MAYTSLSCGTAIFPKDCDLRVLRADGNTPTTLPQPILTESQKGLPRTWCALSILVRVFGQYGVEHPNLFKHRFRIAGAPSCDGAPMPGWDKNDLDLYSQRACNSFEHRKRVTLVVRAFPATYDRRCHPHLGRQLPLAESSAAPNIVNVTGDVLPLQALPQTPSHLGFIAKTI